MVVLTRPPRPARVYRNGNTHRDAGPCRLTSAVALSSIPIRFPLKLCRLLLVDTPTGAPVDVVNLKRLFTLEFPSDVVVTLNESVHGVGGIYSKAVAGWCAGQP